MRIPEDTVNEIMRRADLAEVARSFLDLKRAGEGLFKACCPFHHEKTPSFQINTSMQVYHCFGCGAGGNIITFVKNMVNTDYVGALRWLAQRYDITIREQVSNPAERAAHQRRDEGLRLLEDATGWFQSMLNSPEGALARQYLQQRGLDNDTVKKFRIGYAPDGGSQLLNWALQRGYSKELLIETGLCADSEKSPGRIYDRFRNRLMFTICDELSRPVAFSGRVLGPTPPRGGKYVNSPESQFFHKAQILYGYNFARAHFKQLGFALICEGQLDVIACHRAGLEQAIASQGTAFTTDHARLLKRANVQCVHLAFDGDAAGHKATLHTIGILQSLGMQVMITTIPEGDDPDSVFKIGGAPALQQIMSNAEPAIPFALKVAQQNHSGGTPEDTSGIVTDMLNIIATIQDPVAAAGHCQWLANILHLPENIVMDQLNARKSLALEEEKKREEYERRGNAEMTACAGVPNDVSQSSPSMMQHPQYTIPQVVLSQDGIMGPVLELLLELCMISQDIATALSNEDELLAELPDCAALQAINQIIAGVHDGEWAETVAMLPNSDFISDNIVSKVLARPQIDLHCSNLGAIYSDCLNRLRLSRLEKEAKAITVKLDNNTEDEFASLNRARDLALQRQKLRRGTSLFPTNSSSQNTPLQDSGIHEEVSHSQSQPEDFTDESPSTIDDEIF